MYILSMECVLVNCLTRPTFFSHQTLTINEISRSIARMLLNPDLTNMLGIDLSIFISFYYLKKGC